MSAIKIWNLIEITLHVFKTHIFENLEDNTGENLKNQPIISQIGMFTFNTTKAILNYLRPLCKNEYSINDTQKFPSILLSISPSQDYKKDVSYDAGSLFINIPIEETINYITEQICIHKKLTLLNEIKFLKKFHKFTNNSFRILITWKTRNIRLLLRLRITQKALQLPV